MENKHLPDDNFNRTMKKLKNKSPEQRLLNRINRVIKEIDKIKEEYNQLNK